MEKGKGTVNLRVTTKEDRHHKTIKSMIFLATKKNRNEPLSSYHIHVHLLI